MHAYITKDGIFCPDPRDHFLVVNDPGDDKSEEVLDAKDIDPTGSASFRAYPNPTTDVFTIDLHEFNRSELVRIDVYGMRGELIKYREVSAHQAHQHLFFKVFMNNL